MIVDEAQFMLPYQIKDLRRLADETEADIHCFGLRTDFRGSLFPGAQRLLELADEVEVIKVACECGREAVINARIGADGRPEAKGDTYEMGDVGERYRPMCYGCWQAALNGETKEGSRR